jgi:hypothetical protein
VFPDLELVHYAEQIGQVPANANSIRAGDVDFNVLMQQQGLGAAVTSLKPGASAEVTLKMEAVHDGNRRSARLWREEPVLR